MYLRHMFAVILCKELRTKLEYLKIHIFHDKLEHNQPGRLLYTNHNQ